MRRALIFDFGGVLMKTVDHAPRHAWDDRLGLTRGTVERAVHNEDSWLQAQTGRITPAAYWAQVAAHLGLNAAETAQLAADFYSGDVLDEMLIDYIRQLRQAGHAIALLSNDSAELNAKLDALEIRDLFDPCIISAHIGVMKPDAGAYTAVLAALQRPPEATIFIDDRLENVQGAAALGIQAVHYHAGMDLKAALANLLHQ